MLGESKWRRLVALMGLLWWSQQRRGWVSTGARSRSRARLIPSPFCRSRTRIAPRRRNTSPDGLTESIINNLTQLPNLRVIARSSVFRYKGKADDPFSAGKTLGVRAVVVGALACNAASI